MKPPVQVPMRPPVRFEKWTAGGGNERIHWMWLLGIHGAVSTWFSDTTAVIGRSVCSGVSTHSPKPLDGYDHHYPCEFLEGECWCQLGSALYTHPIVEAYDQGHEHVVWAWLLAHYEALMDAQGYGTP